MDPSIYIINKFLLAGFSPDRKSLCCGLRYDSIFIYLINKLLAWGLEADKCVLVRLIQLINVLFVKVYIPSFPVVKHYNLDTISYSAVPVDWSL